MHQQQEQATAPAESEPDGKIKTTVRSSYKGDFKSEGKPDRPYTSLLGNNGDFGDYFWADGGSSRQDDASLKASRGSDAGAVETSYSSEHAEQ